MIAALADALLVLLQALLPRWFSPPTPQEVSHAEAQALADAPRDPGAVSDTLRHRPV